MPPPPNRDGFRIAIICALRDEADAVEAIFDEIYEEDGLSYHKYEGDPNQYVLGRIGIHQVVLLQTPGIGKVNAANAAAGCRSSFTKIKLGLVVGVCGGVPEPSKGVSIFKGDIIISTYVVQSDFGRQYEEGIQRRRTLADVLTPHTPDLKIFLNSLQGQRNQFLLKKRMETVISEMECVEWYNLPDTPERATDYVYRSDYLHLHRDGSCEKCLAIENGDDEICEAARESFCSELECAPSGRLNRTTSNSQASKIHFGKLGSSDQAMKSAVHRDAIVKEDGVLGFEMEGAGVWDIFPTIVVKSVCNYADSHKDNAWQMYAATRAAAMAKAMLSMWRGSDAGSIAQPSEPVITTYRCESSLIIPIQSQERITATTEQSSMGILQPGGTGHGARLIDKHEMTKAMCTMA